MLGQLEVVDDVRPEQAQGIREGREPEARVELLGDGRAAEQRAPLQDQRLEPGLGQVGAVGQAVVTATDDDRVVRPVGGAGLPLRRLRGFEVLGVFGMSGRLPAGVVEREAGRPRGHVLVAVVHVDLQSDGRARGGKGRSARGPGRCGAAASGSTCSSWCSRPGRCRRRTGTSRRGSACGPWAGSGRPRRRSGRSRPSRRSGRSAASATSCRRARARSRGGR